MIDEPLFECTACGQSFPPAEVYNHKGSIVCINCFAIHAAQTTTRRSVSRALASVSNARMIAKAGVIALGLILLLNVNIPIGRFQDQFWWQLFEHSKTSPALRAIGFLCGYTSLAAVAAIVLGTVLCGTSRAISLVALAALPILCMAIAMPLAHLAILARSAEMLNLSLAAALLIVARCRWIAPVDPRSRAWQSALAIALLAFLAISIFFPPNVVVGRWVQPPPPTWFDHTALLVHIAGGISAAIGAIFSLVQLGGVRPASWRIIWITLTIYIASPVVGLIVNFVGEYQKYHAILVNGSLMFYARSFIVLYAFLGLIVVAINEALITNFFTRIVEPETTGAFPVLPLTITAPGAASRPIDPPIPSNPPPI